MDPRSSPFALIDTDAFRHNLRVVRNLIPTTTDIIAVVKANGYGHGASLIAREAVKQGVAMLAVARDQEALDLRNEGIDHPMLVLGSPTRHLLDETIGAGVVHTVGSNDDAEAISVAASRAGKTAVVHVKIDTGMARLGFDPIDAVERICRVGMLPRLEIRGIFSHFATAEDPSSRLSHRQLDIFATVLNDLEGRGVRIPHRHMANSAAILSHPESFFDFVRPGIMLYGYAPSESMHLQVTLRPVLSLRSSVVHLRTADAGTGVSYGHRYVTRERTTLATVPMGYGDGYSRLLTGRAEALVGGRRYPVAGTICMDLLVLDLGPDPPCGVGDEVVFIGQQGDEVITAWDLARTLGTIPYEVTCAIAPRVRRSADGVAFQP